MITKISAQISLFAFAVAVLAGVYVQNPPLTVLLRAIAVLFLAGTVAQFSAWTGKLVLREHLRRKKTELDQAHLAASASRATAVAQDPA